MRALFFCLLLFALPSAASEREVYAPALEDAPWQFVQDGQQCHLLQQVPRVGSAMFVMGREQQIAFQLQGYRRPAGETLALIRLDPPAWQHGRQAETLQEILLAPKGELTRLDKPLADRLLQELEHGRVVSFFFPDWADGQHALTIRLLPVGFRAALRDFLACPEQLPAPPPVKLPPQPPRHVVWFATDRSELTEDAANRIERICQDIKRYGPAVKQVLLEARADERGTESHNLQLSEERAQVVAESLVECGLDQHILSIQVLGEAHPDPAGSEPEAWRKNRRVVVTLLGEQGQPPQAAPSAAAGEQKAGQAADAADEAASEEKPPAP